MSRVGLTEKEEKHYLLLLEGDVSDIELEESDEEDFDENDAFQQTAEVDEDSISQHVTLPNQNISFELEDDLDFDLEDDIPLARLLPVESSSKYARKKKEDLIWQKNDISLISALCDITTPGPASIEMTPLSYFKQLVDDDMIANIVQQTNLYSVQNTGTSINTTYTEICQFIGINIYSGIFRVPSYRMYWSNETRFSPIADIMSRNRFDKLRSTIHISDNSKMKLRDDENYDKLFKIRPFIDQLKINLAKIKQEEFNSVDEIMIPFKGRSALKQYVKNKPHKWGIKMFARAGRSGIVYDFEVYVGKGTVKDSVLGISGDIVVRLIENLPKNKNYKIFTDNWFSSYDLFSNLKELGVLAAGTVRIARMPGCQLKSDGILKEEGRGSFDYMTEKNRNLIVVKWYDNKAVHVASTYKGLHPIETVKRWSLSERKYIEVPRPAIIEEYNRNMGGVDLNDMLVSLYRIRIGVRRFYLRIIYHLVDICVVNAWLLYRRDCAQRNETKFKKLVTFRSEIAIALMKQNTSNTRKRGRPSAEPLTEIQSPPQKRVVVPNPIDDVRYDEVGHWPVHIDQKKRCRNCISAYSRIACKKCNIALCLTKDKNCFYNFHDK